MAMEQQKDLLRGFYFFIYKMSKTDKMIEI